MGIKIESQTHAVAVVYFYWRRFVGYVASVKLDRRLRTFLAQKVGFFMQQFIIL